LKRSKSTFADKSSRSNLFYNTAVLVRTFCSIDAFYFPCVSVQSFDFKGMNHTELSISEPFYHIYFDSLKTKRKMNKHFPSFLRQMKHISEMNSMTTSQTINLLYFLPIIISCFSITFARLLFCSKVFQFLTSSFVSHLIVATQIILETTNYRLASNVKFAYQGGHFFGIFFKYITFDVKKRPKNSPICSLKIFVRGE
jgi:hypothetical protein